MTVPARIGREELFVLVDERRQELRNFLDWAARAEEGGRSMRMRNRQDITRAAEAAELFAERWWGVVVYSCFDSTKGAETVAPLFQEPMPPEHAEAVLDQIRLEPGSIGGHRIQPAVKGAKKALIGACANDQLFHDVLHSDESFHERYIRLRKARVPQWGRTTVFDLLLRAGALAVGGEHYEPEYAHIEGSTGPRRGFIKVWGRKITREKATWAEAVLRAWTEEWDAVAHRVGVRWEGKPYTPSDFENSLCIWQEQSP